MASPLRFDCYSPPQIIEHSCGQSRESLRAFGHTMHQTVADTHVDIGCGPFQSNAAFGGFGHCDGMWKGLC